MKIVRVGGKRINLEYLITAEEWNGTADTAGLSPGDVLVTMETGRQFALHDTQARDFLRALDAEIDAATPLVPAVAEVCDPQAEDSLPRVTRENE